MCLDEVGFFGVGLVVSDEYYVAYVGESAWIREIEFSKLDEHIVLSQDADGVGDDPGEEVAFV